MTRFHAFLAFLALFVLRIAVGFHFFKEGTSKLESGTFTSEYFLAAAKGPLAPKFRAILDDPDGETILCVNRIKTDDGVVLPQIDPDPTFERWAAFVAKAKSYHGFGSEQLQSDIAARREKLGEQIREADREKDSEVDTEALKLQRAEDEQAIKAIRRQVKGADKILANHKLLLDDFLKANETDLVSHFATADRQLGFQRDGEDRARAGTEVESLRYQIDEIKSDRKKKLRGWKKEVADIWASLELQINDLAVADQAARTRLPLERSYAPANSQLSLVNKIIPWFDFAVGALLILGLFTRLASLAGATFLASVLAIQPPWIPGVTTTGPGSVYMYAIEFAALLVIFATCAGRMGGLDFFIHQIFGRKKSLTNAESGASQ